jgi:hypothetical protein
MRKSAALRLSAIILIVFFLLPVGIFAQGGAAAWLPSDIGATWDMAGVQTDSAGNQEAYSYREHLTDLTISDDEYFFTINRVSGSEYELRTHGDTLFTDIRNAIGGLLPESIDLESIQFTSPWIGFARTDIEPGTEWTAAQFELRVAMPDELKAAFPSIATPLDTMDVYVNINGIREENSTRVLDFEEVDVVSYTTVIDLTATVAFLIFGQRNSVPISLIEDYEIINEYSEGLGLVYRSSDVYEVIASGSYLGLFNFEDYLFTIPGNEVIMTGFSTGTSTPAPVDELTSRFELLQNYPNPFNPSTSIRFNLENPGRVYLDVYSVNGQHIASLAQGERFGTGLHSTVFDGQNIASGIYLYRIRIFPDDGSGVYSAVRRMTLIK